MYYIIDLICSLSLYLCVFVCLEYLIEFEEVGSERNEWEELGRVLGSKQRHVLPLMPFISYRFRVIAINEIGKSDPSMQTDPYHTPAARK